MLSNDIMLVDFCLLIPLQSFILAEPSNLLLSKCNGTIGTELAMAENLQERGALLVFVMSLLPACYLTACFPIISGDDRLISGSLPVSG